MRINQHKNTVILAKARDSVHQHLYMISTQKPSSSRKRGSIKQIPINEKLQINKCGHFMQNKNIPAGGAMDPRFREDDDERYKNSIYATEII